ncbi:MAG: alpha/beta fold hydrolase [Myxococcales bacterium]|nr:alpha/beta fold hydrolase [Myxococcales bacterium]
MFDRGGGIRMHVIDEGAGPPVVLLHGNPTWSFLWRDLIAALCTNHRCIAPDHVGMGLSDKPSDTEYSYTLATRVADVAALVASLQLAEPVTLVVHDWGGMIGFGWATQHPEQVARLVILNTAAFPLPPGKPFPWPLRLTRTPLGALLVRGANAFAWTATHAAMARTKMSAAVRAAYLAPYDSWQHRIATLRFVQDIPLRPGDPAMAIVHETAARLPLFAATPAFIGWGGKDFVFDGAFLAQWRRHLTHAQVHEFADAGHFVLEDAGAELIPLITAFVRAA